MKSILFAGDEKMLLSMLRLGFETLPPDLKSTVDGNTLARTALELGVPTVV